jgi:hypothetical protein
LHEDAAHLYELAKDDSKVIELLCRLLRCLISQSATIESESWRIQNRALLFALCLKASGSTLPNMASTFFLLLDLGTFFFLCHEENYNEALKVFATRKRKIIHFSNATSFSRPSPNFDLFHWL